MSTTEVVPARAQIMPLDVTQTRAAMAVHQEQLNNIVDAHDWQEFADRQGNVRRFLKRGGWRKIAFWYALDLEVVRMDIERNDQDEVIRAHVIARARHPNGRFADGDGGCSVQERGFAKPEHDIAAVAVTRATNRAISNLVGMGDLSAEELDGAGAEQAGAVAVATLDADAQREVAQALQKSWPGYDAHRFMEVLGKRLGGGVPESAGIALRAWQWWLAEAPNATGNVSQEPENAPVEGSPYRSSS
jgi:voltage-gated potassium channel Kch